MLLSRNVHAGSHSHNYFYSRENPLSVASLLWCQVIWFLAVVPSRHGDCFKHESWVCTVRLNPNQGSFALSAVTQFWAYQQISIETWMPILGACICFRRRTLSWGWMQALSGLVPNTLNSAFQGHCGRSWRSQWAIWPIGEDNDISKVGFLPNSSNQQTQWHHPHVFPTDCCWGAKTIFKKKHQLSLCLPLPSQLWTQIGCIVIDQRCSGPAKDCR